MFEILQVFLKMKTMTSKLNKTSEYFLWHFVAVSVGI
jgi:hypothetical protein